MKRQQENNINTRHYWNSIYGTPLKRSQYAQQGTHSHGQKAVAPTNRFEYTLTEIEDGQRVVDMGCGVGVLTKMIKEQYPMCEVWGTDISDQAIADNQLENSTIVYHQAFIGKQEALPDKYFDVVFSGEVLEHLEKPEELFQDAKRVLRKGGKFIITTPREDSIKSAEHVWEYSYSDIEKLYRENGFEAPRFVYLPDLEHLLVIYAVGVKK